MNEDEIIEKKIASIIAGANCYPFLFIGSGMSIRYMNTRNWNDLLEWVCYEVYEDDFAYTRVTNQAKTSHRNGEIDAVMPYVATLIEDDANRILLTSEKFGWFRKRYMRELKEGVSPVKQLIADDLAKAKMIDCEETQVLARDCAQKVSGIITTNYDYLAEGLFPQSDVFVGGDDMLFREMSYSAEIYKIHGSASQPDSMVLNQADYAIFREKQAYLAAKILTVFVEYPIIFLGYSLQDPDMASILESIAKCVGADHLDSLTNRFVFVEYGDTHDDPVRIMQKTFGGETISMTHIVTKDFLPVFKALGSAATMYDPRVVRKLRQSIYAIAAHLDPTSTLVTSGFSELNNLSEDDRIILGFSPLTEGYGRMPTAEDLYYDVLFNDNEFSPELVARDYLPKLLKSNSGGLPMYRYLRGLDPGSFELLVREHIDKRRTIDDFLNDGIRSTSEGWRDKLCEYSIDGLVNTFGFDKAHERLAALNPEETEVDQLGAHLSQVITRSGGKSTLLNNSELKRAIRIYDFLKYHDGA